MKKLLLLAVLACGVAAADGPSLPPSPYGGTDSLSPENACLMPYWAPMFWAFYDTFIFIL